MESNTVIARANLDLAKYIGGDKREKLELVFEVVTQGQENIFETPRA